MEINTENTKKVWERPQLSVFGDIEQITAAQYTKSIGPDDGLVFITNSDITIGS